VIDEIIANVDCHLLSPKLTNAILQVFLSLWFHFGQSTLHHAPNHLNGIKIWRLWWSYIHDNFNDVIFTDECSVQLHGNKIAVYRLKDSVAPLIPMPKHPYKVNVSAGISRRGTSILIFDGIMKSSSPFGHISEQLQ
jgi:hypothetical protein